MLLLHGLSDSAECWMPFVRHFAGDRMVVAVDARGHGRTPLGDEAFTMAALARDAVAVLREVVGRPALVVGHSMGALVAEEIALTAPDLVAALVLEEPAWSAASDTSDDGVPTFMAASFAAFAGVPEVNLARWSQAQNPAWADDEHGLWARAKVQVDQRLAQVAQDWGGRDWLEELAMVTCPVTLVTGVPERGSVVSAADRARAAELLGDNLVDVQLPGAGHSARREDRAGFIAALDHALGTVVEP
jgi:lipase